ncbi:lutropin-choriogonadotropic hormone receptor-like [Pocillopora damicornis]|uniref:lutropin-choriogonadotropic hormone receptor-like n=1 Tax=Pocillopora damicornis TaxID=46731 RepID=UPI000F55774D|nr:lutropin-choriogonadotropic hormone receptor-like [Pocillopora damicornis]
MAVLWHSVAVFLSLLSIIEGWQYSKNHRGPYGCVMNTRGEVDCTSNNFTSIPAEIPRNVIALDMSDNMISELTNFTFSRFPNLTKLTLNGNKLYHVQPNAFEGLKHLRILSLKDNDLKTCPEFGVHLKSLNELYLTGNKMNTIKAGVFKEVPNIEHLWLDNNNLTEVPAEALKSLKELKYLSLESNKIRIIRNSSFQSQSKLESLICFNNEIIEIEDDGFKGLDSLKYLSLMENNLSQVPVSLKDVKNICHLELSSNPIDEIPDHAFKGLIKLRTLRFTWEKLNSVGHNAFANLPKLKTRLRLVNLRLEKFPNLTGTSSLQYLTLTVNKIRELPTNLCQNLKELVELTLDFNKIERLPDLSECKSLSVLKIEHNEITSIEGSLQNLKNLKDLTLKGNKIQSLPSRTFEGVEYLEVLNLAENEIRYIAEDAFAPFEMIKFLDLSNNCFPVLPAKGLETLKTLKVRGNRELKGLPAAKLHKIRTVEAHYPYHCCDFRKQRKKKESPVRTEKLKTSEFKNSWTWAEGEEVIFLRNSPEDNLTSITSNEEMSGFGSGNIDPAMEFDGSSEIATTVGSGQVSNVGRVDDISIDEDDDHQVTCTPEPADPFFPCDDLMDSSLLRIGVWIVFLLALLGNAIVIFVIITRSSRIDVSRFLICNLAVADLCMGVYLGLLAVVDASTLGNFRSYGVEWQLSPGCRTAGFLAVLSSETSVFTLTVITIERYIAITHALDITKKMSLKKTYLVMLVGWCFALTVATLPLFGVSDYTKFSVCLPFETGNTKSLVYVTSVLILNGSAFIVILTCYCRIYSAIRGSNAWNTNDSRTALRMAILIFTDFSCWAPITVFSLTAAFGGEYVSLKDAKIFTVFVFPLNSCANPFLYAIFTAQFKRDCISLCRRVKSSQIPKITSSRRKYSYSSGEMRRNSQVSSSNGLEGMIAKLRPREQRRNSLPPSMRLMVSRPANSKSSETVRKEVIVEKVTVL